MSEIIDIIDEIIRVEDGYVNHPDDSGGPTKYGITLRVLREVRPGATLNDVKNLTVQDARDIYKSKYFVATQIEKIYNISKPIGIEVFDAAINMGPSTSIKLLQRVLNVFNKKGTLYPDIPIDGVAGSDTQNALRAFLTTRGYDGAEIMHKALICLRGAKYIDIAERSPKNESFVYGWIKNRVIF